METIEIKVEKRSESGKKYSSSLRRAGNIPCVIYGLGKPEKLLVNAYNFRKALSGPGGTNVILRLDLGDGKTLHNAILKELQHHPLTDEFIHADLLEIDMNKPIRIKLPLEFKGDPVGVKLKGGDMRIHMRNIMVECMPAAIPTSIVVEVASLDLNVVWHISDLKIPAGIVIKEAPAKPVVSCQTYKEVKEEVAVVAVAEGAEGATPADGTAPAAGGKAPAGGKGAAPAAGGKAPAGGKGAAPAAGGKAPAGGKK